VAVQLAAILVILALAWGIRLATHGLTDRLFARLEPYLPARDRLRGLRRLVWLAYAWLLLVVAERVAARFGAALPLVGIAATLAALWIVLRASSLLFRDALLARLVAIAAWIIAALDITGLMAPTAAALDSAALTIGTVRLSLLIVVKAALIIAILLWAALALARLIAARLQYLALSPSAQTLAGNVVKIVLVSLAVLIGLAAVGINLTALAVFSGAIGVGIGFGLQKIVANFVSGIILLMERSIKPGDVIEVGSTHGTVASLGARYAAVRGRDGKEYLIPNETLITNQVVNWSYSSPLRRLDVKFGVGYGSDLRVVRRLAIEAAARTPRVLAAPAPVCHITAFGDSSINLVLRFWIDDPTNGVVNVTGDVFLALWDTCRGAIEAAVGEQRDIRIRELPAEWLAPSAAERRAAE
jgi:small-conductance mechanosensitive channel